ncbi:MAG: hypothetical protein LPK45_01210, partial [Bacteroidota bacterium]|nr:hypothetical protein [Bacteroidota bacterium]MDX5429650.1 hypothetical protein [Bacteroidota bacterium]MDX5468431.1 hypothetical protein [Bacteroidota bacterium]
CYREPWQTHGLADYFNDGWFTLTEETQPRTFTFTLRDSYGNENIYTLTIKSSGQVSKIEDSLPAFPGFQQQIIFNDAVGFQLNRAQILVDFFRNSFSDSVRVFAGYLPGGTDTLQLAPETGYVGDRFRVSFTLPKEKRNLWKKACIGRVDGDEIEYLGSTWSGNQVAAFSRHLGKFMVVYDTVAPLIQTPVIRQDTLLIEITDDFSGIANYIPTINGKWFLMEYDPKSNTLLGLLSDFKMESKLELQLLVKDQKDNSNHLKTTLSIK